jgi:hypothetical protein
VLAVVLLTGLEVVDAMPASAAPGGALLPQPAVARITSAASRVVAAVTVFDMRPPGCDE